MPGRLVIRMLLGSWAAAGAWSAWSQSTPPVDAGAVRQQIERQRDAFTPPPAVLPPVSLPLDSRPIAGPGVEVKRFRFEGNSLLSSEQLQPAVRAFVGQTLDFKGLQRAADRVAAAYRDAGWVARVYLPEQDVSEGTITLEVVEARFAGLRFEGALPKHVQPEAIKHYFTARQTVGQPLNARALDRALLLVDDLPGVSVAGTLVPGQADGDTALVLQTADEALFSGDLGMDNLGARSLGSLRATANFTVHNSGGLGESLSLNLLRTQGSDYTRVALSVPVGYQGSRLSLSVSDMSYRVIRGPGYNSAAQIHGTSSSLGAEWSHPLWRASMRNLYFYAGVENKTFFTQDTQLRSDYVSRSARVGLSSNQFDGWAGGGVSSASLHVLWGQLSDMRAHTQLDTIPRYYRKISYQLSRQQNLGDKHSLLLSFNGQQAWQVLDSSEKFYIGGASSVRAYPASEQGGERGQVLSAEWRWRVHSAWTASAFADQGWVLAMPANASDPASRVRLQGAGLSLAWRHAQGWNTRLTWARRIDSNPKPTASGTDGDGTLARDRFWLTAGLQF